MVVPARNCLACGYSFNQSNPKARILMRVLGVLILLVIALRIATSAIRS